MEKAPAPATTGRGNGHLRKAGNMTKATPFTPDADRCRAHLIRPGMKPCGSINLNATTDGGVPVNLCETHLTVIGSMHTKRKPPTVRTVVETKTRRRTQRTSERDDYEQRISELNQLITTLNSELSKARAPKQRSTATDGTVYYLRIGGYIKIGWTSDMGKRMKAYPPDTVLLATQPGTRSDEAAEHKRFAHLRTHGREWYPLAPQLTQHIDRIVQANGEPDTVSFMAKPADVPRPHSGQGGPKPKSWIRRTA